MPGQMSFHHDTDDDVIVVRHHWDIQNFADILLWQEQYEAYLLPFGRKMDVVSIVDDLRIGATIGRAWSEARARTYRKYILRSCRVRTDGRLDLIIETIGARYPDLPTDKASSVEGAIEIIREMRRRFPGMDVQNLA